MKTYPEEAAADRILHDQPEDDLPQGGPPEEMSQNVRDVLSLLQDLRTNGPDPSTIAAVRGMLDEMRMYDPQETPPEVSGPVDDFCSAVESYLAGMESSYRDPRENEGVVGNPANVGKSLGEIAEETFPELHRADAWGHPRRGAPGSALAQFDAASRRIGRMRIR